MKNLQKLGGLAALYLAASHLIGIVLFIFILDYINIVEPAQKVALLVDKPMLIYATNLLMYIIFGVVLVVLVLALYERLQAGAPAAMRIASVIGIIWAGVLIASGTVANAGIAPVLALYANDPAQAALTWLTIESVANGLGGAEGELLGGLWVLLVSWSALRTGGLPKGLNYLGLVVGVIGLVSTIPGMKDLTSLFGISQIIWFIVVGIVLLRRNANPPL